MKRYLLILTAGLAAMAACQSVMEEPFTPEEFMDEGVVFEACASSPLAVRSHFIDADEGTAKEGTLYWDEGEKVGVLSLFWYDIPSFDSMVWGTDWDSKFDAHMVELSADVENGHFVGRPFTKYVQSDLATVEIDPTDGNQAKLHSSLTMSQWLMNVDEAIRIGIYDFIMIYPMTAKPAPVVMYKMQSGTPTIGVPVKIATDQYVSEGFGKYQLCMDSGFDYAQMERAYGLQSSEELLHGTKVVFDNVNPITPLLEFTIKCDSDTPVPISYLKVFTDDTPIAGDAYASAQGMAKFLVYCHWADDGEVGKSTSNAINLHFPEGTTVSSTASTEKYHISLFPSYYDGYVEVFNNDGTLYEYPQRYAEYLQSYGGETLYFEAYDASDNLVMTAQKTIPDEGFKAGHRYKFALEMTAPEAPWDYHMDNLSDITVPYYGKTDKLASNFKSYRTRGSESEAVPFTLEYSETGEDGTWTTTAPDWLVPAVTNDYSGSVTGKNLGMKVMPQTNASVTDTYHATLAAKTPKEDFDLSTLNVATGETISRTTANCYVIQAPGTYKFPVVYGNGVKKGAINTSGYVSSKTGSGYLQRFVDHLGNGITSPYIATQHAGKTLTAKLMWTDEPGLVTDVAISGSGEDTYISFEVPEKYITHGNAMIAVLADGVIAWSWHIWVTTANLTTLKNGRNGYKFATVNLGWCAGKTYTYNARTYKVRAVQSQSGNATAPITITETAGSFTTGGNSPFYQFGRKDPTAASTGQVQDLGMYPTPFKTYYSDDLETLPSMVYSADKISIQTTITAPNVYFAMKTTDWCTPVAKNLWSTNPVSYSTSSPTNIKTVYDPSPVGYKVPRIQAFEGIDQYNGYFTTTTSGTPIWYYRDGDIQFPATGRRNYASGGENSDYGLIDDVGYDTAYWAVDPDTISNFESYVFSFSHVGDAGQTRTMWSHSRSFGYSVRSVQDTSL